jgi:hypothetical protein
VVAFGVVSASVGSSMIPIVRRNGPRGRFDASAQLWDITPWVIVAKVQESAPAVKPPLDCVFIKQRLMAAIGSAEPATRGTHQ